MRADELYWQTQDFMSELIRFYNAYLKQYYDNQNQATIDDLIELINRTHPVERPHPRAERAPQKAKQYEKLDNPTRTSPSIANLTFISPHQVAAPIQLIHENASLIIEHAERRIDFFFYVLLLCFNKNERITVLNPDRQRHQLVHGYKNYPACHSAIIANLQIGDTPLEGYFPYVLNTTIELPRIVNNFDMLIERGRDGGKACAQAILQQVSYGFEPKDAIVDYLAHMIKLFNDIKPTGNDFQKKLIWFYQSLGTFHHLWSCRGFAPYIYTLLQVSEQEQELFNNTLWRYQKYQQKVDEIEGRRQIQYMTNTMTQLTLNQEQEVRPNYTGNFSDQEFRQVTEDILHNRLKELNLVNLGINDLTYWVALLQTNVSVEEFAFYENPIDAKGMIPFFNIINNTQIKKLYLSELQLDDEALIALATALQNNNTLTKLGLVYIKNITNLGVNALLQAMKNNNVIQNVNIDFSDANDMVIDTLCDVIRENKSIKILDFQTNELTDNQINKIFTALQTNTTLTMIGLGDVDFGEQQATVDWILNRNKRLHNGTATTPLYARRAAPRFFPRQQRPTPPVKPLKLRVIKPQPK